MIDTPPARNAKRETRNSQLPMLPYLPSTVAEAIAAALDDAAAATGSATLAIPGGRSPGPVLTALAGLLTPFVRQRLTLLWLDERAVPRGHPDRNDAPTLAAWQAGGPLPARVLPMPAEDDDLDAAAEHYAAALVDPIDVCLIGIGEDGHLASLFPNHPGLGELSAVFVVRDSPKPPATRLTMGLAPICAARQRFVLALGSAKGVIAAKARAGRDPALPVSLLPDNGTTWFLDDAAARTFEI